MYAELLGKGGYYSINYERRILQKRNHNLNIHLGFAYPIGPNFVFKNSVLVSPFSFYYSFGRVIQAEIGVGINQYIDLDPKRDYPSELKKPYTIIYSPSVGVRLETKRNFLFRATFCPLFIVNKDKLVQRNLYFISWFGISIGYRF